MKVTLLLAASLFASTLVRSQDMTFSIDQTGQALKGEKAARFADAELKDANITIRWKDNTVQVVDDKTSSYQLVKMEYEKKVNAVTSSQFWTAVDKENHAVTLKVTVNSTTKESLVELDTPQAKNYYFGRWAGGEKLARW